MSLNISRITLFLVIQALGFLVAVVISEVALRAVGWSAPIFRKSDPEVGWRFQPFLTGYHRKENVAWIEINRSGFRGPDFAVNKSAEQHRVLLLGDSFTFGGEVPFEQTFGALYEKTSPGLKVFNLGVTGYGTTQQLLTYRRWKQELLPQEVILTIHVGNDISDNQPELAESISDSRPYFTNSLEPLPGYPNPEALKNNDLLAAWLNSLRVLQLAKEALNLIYALRVTNSVEKRNLGLYAPPTDQLWSDAWTRTLGSLELLVREVRGDNASLRVLVVPEDKRPNCGSAAVYQPCYPTKRIVSFLQQLNVPVRDVGEVFFKAGDANLFRGFTPESMGRGHFNQQGHQKIAQVLDSQW